MMAAESGPALSGEGVHCGVRDSVVAEFEHASIDLEIAHGAGAPGKPAGGCPSMAAGWEGSIVSLLVCGEMRASVAAMIFSLAIERSRTVRAARHRDPSLCGARTATAS
jgi:hypothetical protein